MGCRADLACKEDLAYGGTWWGGHRSKGTFVALHHVFLYAMLPVLFAVSRRQLPQSFLLSIEDCSLVLILQAPLTLATKFAAPHHC